jgi:tetratricopeptide (TPR) repeat protein
LAACRQGRGYYPEDAELLFTEAVVRKDQGDASGAIACVQQLIHSQEKEHFGSVVAGLRGHRARHLLGVIYGEQGCWGDAEAAWRQAVAACPEWLPAWLGLGELYLRQGRWGDLEQMAAQLETNGPARVDAAVLRAQGHLARREFAAARELLEKAIATAPTALWPRVILTHVLLQEGRDWDTAERALRDVLALDPGHREARQNLEVLLRQQGKPAG